MQQVKLANVLLEESSQFYLEPLMYVRADAPVLPVDEGTWELRGPGKFDFTTFFNGLSVMKWKKYTTAESYHLHLELKGAACVVSQTRADSFSWDPEVLAGASYPLAASDAWQTIDIELKTTDQDVLVAFMLIADGAVLMRNSYYYATVADEAIRPVELALCTTTIGKEDYIRKNVGLVRKHILESGEDIAGHFRMHVVDNGRTLKAEEIEGPGIELHPNPNVGGSGGFARGMLEAMEQDTQATHVLLMDDDVSVSPESIIRTYNLLRIVNDTYAEAFVSGAMMSLQEPSLLTEDLGFFNFKGQFGPVKAACRATLLHDVVASEAFVIPSDIPGNEDTSQSYAGWWYCCIPMNVIKRKGMPLPLFVRGDDTEYSLRCKPKFITMSGICVWHMAFFFKYSAAVERYQVSRNTFIAQATSGIAKMTDFTKEFHHEVQLDLKKFNYDEAELALDGFEDFLKGPEFIAEPVGEKCFVRANKRREKLVPLERLRDECNELGIDIDQIVFDDVDRDYPRKRADAVLDFLTFNGQRLLGNYTEPGKVAIISAAGWAYPPGKMRRAEILLVVDPITKNAAIRRRDLKRFREVWGRYKRDVKEFKANKDKLYAAYASHFDEFTSVEFWKRYLEKAREPKE